MYQMSGPSGLPAGNWRVAIQIITPEGTVQADNVYSYENESDATEAAFQACEVAEDDCVMPDDMVEDVTDGM